MSELWVPNRGARRGGLTIYVPGKYADRPAVDWVCRVPVNGDGDVCGAVFASEVSLVRHLRECTARHEDLIASGSIEKRIPILASDQWSPEAEKHLERVGERMLAEGRWHLKPNERVHNE